MLVPKRGMRRNGNTMRWLLPLPLEKLMKRRLFKNEIMSSLKHPLSTLSIGPLNVRFALLILHIISILHNGISSELRSPVNVDAGNLVLLPPLC